MQVILHAPNAYWKLPLKEKLEICNGCGSKGGFFNKLIPNGNLKECCNIHDYEYSIARTYEEKIQADLNFRRNCKRVVKASSWYVRPLVNRQAKAYFKAVHLFGFEAFYANKPLANLTRKEITI